MFPDYLTLLILLCNLLPNSHNMGTSHSIEFFLHLSGAIEADRLCLPQFSILLSNIHTLRLDNAYKLFFILLVHQFVCSFMLRYEFTVFVCQIPQSIFCFFVYF